MPTNSLLQPEGLFLSKQETLEYGWLVLSNYIQEMVLIYFSDYNQYVVKYCRFV